MIPVVKTGQKAFIFVDEKVGRKKTCTPWYEGYVSRRR
jgi:hypothetical protein